MIKKPGQFIKGNPEEKSQVFLFILNFVIAVLSLFLALTINWELLDAVMLAVFVWLILIPRQGKTIVNIGIVLLFFTLLLLAIKHKEDAEKIAPFAFANFSLGVLKNFFQIAGNKSSDDK